MAKGNLRVNTNADRVMFINSLGYKIDESFSETKEILIPENFNEVFSNYNEIQNEAGYNLENYKGCPAFLHKYKLLDENKYINLIIYNGEVIGGDVSSPQINGEILPLKNKDENSKAG